MQKKTFALFAGCNIPARLPAYEQASRAVLKSFEVALDDIPGFNCCGYPIRNLDIQSSLLVGANNLGTAAGTGMDILVLCKCCFGQLKTVQHWIDKDKHLRNKVSVSRNSNKVAVAYQPQVIHLLELLHKQIGVKAMEDRISQPLSGLKIAVHYGCHALRPSEITHFDDPLAPRLFDDLVEATGAQSVAWPLKLQCCGAPLMGMDSALAIDFAVDKMADAKRAGADFICTACPWCQLQFNKVQPQTPHSARLPAILFPQLLGMAMGLAPASLGITDETLQLGPLNPRFAGAE